MKILKVIAHNFSSYKHLEFDYTNQGLTLIQGPTGSGKSTLCDLTPWCLFGKTAKGGSVSEVLSWPGDKITTVSLTMADGYTYTRSRGPSAKDNDLCIITENDYGQRQVHRGKDLLDTQKLINQELGMDYELYLAGAYFHEFSQTAQFFTTTAKNRRIISEQLVDLKLATALQPLTVTKIKSLNTTLSDKLNEINKLEYAIQTVTRLQAAEYTKASDWDINRAAMKQRVLADHKRFEANRTKTISNKCSSCGTVLAQPKTVTDTSVNPYIKMIDDLEKESNPHTGSLKDFSVEIGHTKTELGIAKASVSLLTNQIDELEVLQGVIADFRSASINNTIKDLENNTNQILTDHYDAEFRVSFTVVDADKLEIDIYKDGNACSYTQLSKGQRCLLKLSFGLPVMKAVANHHGISFSQIFLDEFLDGLSTGLKIKTYGLLETISQDHESVFVVEHSEELKSCFDNVYTVSLTNEGSVIAKTK